MSIFDPTGIFNLAWHCPQVSGVKGCLDHRFPTRTLIKISKWNIDIFALIFFASFLAQVCHSQSYRPRLSFFFLYWGCWFQISWHFHGHILVQSCKYLLCLFFQKLILTWISDNFIAFLFFGKNIYISFCDFDPNSRQVPCTWSLQCPITNSAFAHIQWSV